MMLLSARVSISPSGLAAKSIFQHTRPLIQNNYRGIGENGKFIDNFWLIDLPFVILFGLEFLVRSFYVSRRHAGLTWLEGMLRRWYDIFLLLPFWRWLVISSDDSPLS